ncbi:MAG: glycosyltransferase family 9 protein [Fimbriimonadaceae bacterium]|nr:MAG: glycosyltransferase family 9 protein [Fimbriimonadaceae bacterium]
MPAAGALKQAHPDCEIVWIGDKRFGDVVRSCRHVTEVVVLGKDWKTWKKTVQSLGEFDAALDLQGLLKSALPIYLSNAKLKLGYHWQREASWLFTQAVQPRKTSIHVVDQYLDVALAASGSVKSVDFGLEPGTEETHRVKAMLEDLGYEPGQKLAVLHAGAGWVSKRWPAENFARLSEELAAHRARVAFIGTQGDSPAVDEVLTHCKTKPISLLGKTNIRELIALLSLADLHVAGDTGSIHLAAGLNTPCIGLYTLTRPERSCPYGQFGHCQSTNPEQVIPLALELINS